MTRLALIRHGPTAWNEAGLIQGRSDPPLGPAGRAGVAGWRLPPEVAGFDLVSSPLCRARETAVLLHGGPVATEPALIEMAWGAWEGRKLADLRAGLGAELAEAEAHGLDFRPPGGESPREVQARLRPWLASCADSGRSTLAVTHKGVIRAIMGLATQWDFLGKPPIRLTWNCVHLLGLAPGGQPTFERINIPLAASRDAS